jgi:NAD(P)-dependent dehydrogenase (short-subunit alcohol dehydrogenase family)
MEAAVVAGVGPGLGAALARAFAGEGYGVGLLSRRASSVEPLADELRSRGCPVVAIAADVSDRSAVFQAVDRIRTELGPTTVVACNAGAFSHGPFLELDPAEILRSFEVGTMGAVHLVQATIPDMLRAGHGAISLTGATASLRGRAGFAPLAMAKASLRMLGQSLAREFHPKGIHVVHVIVDGQIDSPRIRARAPDRPSDTLIPPDAVAQAILHAFKQPRSGWTHELDIRPYTESF